MYEITSFDGSFNVHCPSGQHLATFYGTNARHNAALFVAALKEREQAAINAVNKADLPMLLKEQAS